MNSLSLSHACKTYPRGVVALDDLSIEMGNELLVLMGPSGSGKSTTLRVIAGLEIPTSGEIFVDGKAITALPPRRRGIAMVFQNGALYPHLTVRGNMEFGLRLRRVPGGEIARRVAAAADSLGIASLLNRRPRELSGGEQQRVALGRAIVQEPRLFLLDEPLSSLNAVLRRELRQVIRDLQARLGMPVIYVTHDPQEAMAVGTRIAVLREGRLQQIGAPLELYANPRNRFVAQSLGSPGMNFLEGRVESADRLLSIVIGEQRLEVIECWRSVLKSRTGQAIVIGIRPEHILMEPPGSDRLPFRLAMHVQAVEHFGDEQQATLEVGGQSLVARVPTGRTITNGSQVFIAADNENVYFYDAQTGERIK